jgi:hypothetical protein
MQRQRLAAVPEHFLGLVAIAVAVVWTAHLATGAVHDARHTRDTITVTGSAKKPITSNLVRWAVTVSGEAPSAADAARRLAGELVDVRQFFLTGHVPPAAIAPAVVYRETLVERLPHHQKRVTYRVSENLDITTRQINVIERVSTRLGSLIERGIDVSAEPLQYISTELKEAKLEVLAGATADARKRADILVHGLGSKLGRMRSTSLGVYQITPRDSTNVSDYGINDTSTRDKDVTAVVSATFAVRS